MSIAIQATRIIASLTALGKQFGGPGGPQIDFGGGEYLAASVTGMTADAGNMAMTAMAPLYRNSLSKARQLDLAGRMGGKEGIQKYQRGISLIAWTLTVVEVLELTTGFGQPYDGDELTEGSQQFNALSGQLKLAQPNGSWQGGAAQAYAEADGTLATTASTTADLDLQLAALIQNQADAVTHIRLGFGMTKDLLLAALVVEFALMCHPEAGGPAAAWNFALVASALGLAAALGMLGHLNLDSHDNARLADAVAAQYADLTTTRVADGTNVQAKVASAAEESTVSSFDTDSARVSKTSALSEGPAAALAASGSADQRAAALSPLRDAAEAAADGAAAAAPTVSMPTLAQVSAWSGQAATLSGHASQQMNLFNQTMGSVQQIISMSQQAQPAPAPAAEEPPAEETATEEAGAEETATEEAGAEEAAGEVDGAAAGGGTETGERAPLEAVAVDIHQAHEPDPLVRSA